MLRTTFYGKGHLHPWFMVSTTYIPALILFYYMCGSQRTTMESVLSSTSTWVSGIGLSLPSLHCQHLSLVSHVADPYTHSLDMGKLRHSTGVSLA